MVVASYREYDRRESLPRASRLTFPGLDFDKTRTWRVFIAFVAIHVSYAGAVAVNVRHICLVTHTYSKSGLFFPAFL